MRREIAASAIQGGSSGNFWFVFHQPTVVNGYSLLILKVGSTIVPECRWHTIIAAAKGWHNQTLLIARRASGDGTDLPISDGFFPANRGAQKNDDQRLCRENIR
jgi:hypothetical protein